MVWLSRATLDMIGLAGMSTQYPCRSSRWRSAGFGYSFNALGSSDNELSKAFRVTTRQRASIWPFLQAWIPVLRYLVSTQLRNATFSAVLIRSLPQSQPSGKNGSLTRGVWWVGSAEGCWKNAKRPPSLTLGKICLVFWWKQTWKRKKECLMMTSLLVSALVIFYSVAERLFPSRGSDIFWQVEPRGFDVLLMSFYSCWSWNNCNRYYMGAILIVLEPWYTEQAAWRVVHIGFGCSRCRRAQDVDIPRLGGAGNYEGACSCSQHHEGRSERWYHSDGGWEHCSVRLLATTGLLNANMLFRVGKGDPVYVPILAINRSKELWGEDSFEFKYSILHFIGNQTANEL